MKIRADRSSSPEKPAEIRSVGNPPNGVLMPGYTENGPEWAITSAFVPAGGASVAHQTPGVRVGITVKAITAGGMPDDAVPIEPDQLVAAVEDPFTLSAIAHLLIAAVKVTTNAYAGSMDFDRLILMNEWADRTAHLLVWRRQQLLAEGGT